MLADSCKQTSSPGLTSMPQAFGVISWGSAAAALSHATKVIVKTPHEAMGVPTAEANAQGLGHEEVDRR